jgi:hypothetical protein
VRYIDRGSERYPNQEINTSSKLSRREHAYLLARLELSTIISIELSDIDEYVIFELAYDNASFAACIQLDICQPCSMS